jgi:ribA/ribD-fused uncharacterized protein
LQVGVGFEERASETFCFVLFRHFFSSFSSLNNLPFFNIIETSTFFPCILLSHLIKNQSTSSVEGANKAQFVLDDRHWASVEHYFQASKFRHINDAYYESFTIESGSSLGLGGSTRAVAIDSGSLARTAGRKLRLSQEQLDQWAKRKHAVMERALYAKFSQNPSLKVLLLATGDAKLTHRPSRSKFVSVEYGLMRYAAGPYNSRPNEAALSI